MNLFLSLFRKNIKSTYTCYDRVILRGYILWMFSPGSLINFLRSMRFKKHTNGVMRVFTDQLNSHIEKTAKQFSIPILWWPSVDGGKNGNKLRYVEKKFAKKLKKKSNFVYCVIADRESVFSYATRELTDKKGKPYDKMYKCRKVVKHYYIYFHDQLLGGPCYLKLSTYFPFYAEFYFNGHNMIKLAMDRKGIAYRKNENAFTMIGDEKAVQKIAWSLSGKQVQERINYWMNRYFRFDKGKYSTLPATLSHNWYCSQVEVCTNIIFKSAQFCTRLFERLLDKYTRIGHQKIAAPDLRKERQIALVTELLNPKYAVHGFRTRDLLKHLSQNFRNLSQIRYELGKLKERGLVEKLQHQSFYRVTEQGYKILWAKNAWNLYFETPMISTIYKKSARQVLSAPSNLESAYRQLDDGLSLVAQELCLKTAA